MRVLVLLVLLWSGFSFGETSELDEIRAEVVADSYYCIVKASGGLKFENDEYTGARFSPKDHYILRKATDEDRDAPLAHYARYDRDQISWTFVKSEEGERFNSQLCTDGGSQIHCKGAGGEFRLDKPSGRFIYSNLGDYASPTENPNHNPHIASGFCAKVN